MILRDFLYIDEGKVDQYLSQVEGGLRSSSSRSHRSAASGGGKAGLPGFVSGEIAREEASEETTSSVDTAMSKFDRLVSLVAGHHDEVNWVEVLSSADLAAAAPRKLLEADLELVGTTDLDQIRPGGALDGLTALADVLGALGGANVAGLPSSDQMAALKNIGEQMQDRMMRGLALADETTTVFGMLPDAGVLRPIEGEARVVGKIITIVPPGSWALPPNLPIYTNLPREKKRELARKGPANPEQQKFWIAGPAIELDVLAVWH